MEHSPVEINTPKIRPSYKGKATFWRNMAMAFMAMALVEFAIIMSAK